MRKIYATLDTGFACAMFEEVFEFDDDVTNEEIDEEIEKWAEDVKAEMCYYWEDEEEDAEAEMCYCLEDEEEEE